MDLDRHQDIARCSYADMLHDDERNHAYYVAIKTVVSYLVNSQDKNPNGSRFYNCCDIGAGSGLLSMMVAKSFLSLGYKSFQVTAYECFEPMSATAREIVDRNQLSKFIKICTERIGDKKPDVNPKYDLLVAELLDTELIGEGCLEIYRFAVDSLCSQECIFIPQKAKIFIEPISSKGLYRRQVLKDQVIMVDGKHEVSIDFQQDVKDCCGLLELDDMQTSYLDKSFNFKRFTEPKCAFDIEFNDLDSLKLNDFNKVTFDCKDTLDEEIVIHMWWEIVMYDGSLFPNYGPSDHGKKYSFSKLSVAPSWSRNAYQRERDHFITQLYGRSIWREHWMQAIYYLPCHEAVRSLVGKRNEKGFKFDIFAYHDAYSLWFDITSCKVPTSCTCGLHRRLNRYEVAFLNNSSVLQDLVRAAAKSAKLSNRQGLKGRLRVLEESKNQTSMKWRLDFWFKSDNRFSTEPLFSLPDYSLMDEVCWRTLLNRYVNQEDIKPIASFKIVLNQVAFDALNRIRSKVGHTQGFDLSPSDELIEASATKADSSVEAHHLWEYSCDILSPEIVVFDTENTKGSSPNNSQAICTEHLKIEVPDLPISRLKAEWAIVLSCNMKLIDGKIIKTGCLDSTLGSAKWNHHFKQLVHFLHDHPILDKQPSGGQSKTIDLKIVISSQSVSIENI